MNLRPRGQQPLIPKVPPPPTAAPPAARTLPAPALALPRRQFAGLVGAAAAGVALTPVPWRPGRAATPGDHTPQPIPGGSPGIQQLTGRLFHVYGPDPRPEGIDPPDAEPSTITDFDGTVALAYISGMVRRTDTATGEVRELPFMDADMRVMVGTFVGADGQAHRGAFAFI